VSVHISSALSGTLASAQQAAAESPEQDIRVVDSRHVSIGLGMMAVEAARAAARGDDANAVVSLLEDLAQRTHTVFVVATLEYLRRGGRIGGAQAFLGSLLGVKPVLEAKDGKVEPVTRVRTFSKAYAAISGYVDQHAPRGLHRAALLHADAEPHRLQLEEQLFGGLPPEVETYPDVSIGSVVATHTGRGAFGIALIANP
jgi:DegV family protein with EDD domain